MEILCMFALLVLIAEKFVLGGKVENMLSLDKGQIARANRAAKEDLCRRQFTMMLETANQQEDWSAKALDAWGILPPTGHLWGHFVDLGNYDECMSITQDLTGTNNSIFVAQYCLAHYPIGKIITEEIPKMGRVFVEARSPTEFITGVCVPDICDIAVLNDIFRNLVFNRTNNTIENGIFNELQCVRKDDLEKFDGIDVFAIIVFSAFGLLIVLSTCYDFYTQNRQRNDVLLAFSLPRNALKLFNVQNSSTSPNTIDCLHGIRCLSIIWIMYGHTLMIIQFLPLVNHVYIWEWVSEYYSMVPLTGPIAVDSFFLLSGLLVALHVLRAIEKSGPMTISAVLKMYLHRYLRLLPILAPTILFAATLFKHIGSGPFWKSAASMTEAPCRKYWWSALLYLQNYINPDSMCLGHTWYLSADTQLYILSPLILIPLARWGKKFLIFIAILILASCSYVFAIMYIHGFGMKMLEAGLTGENDKKILLYYGFHTRAPAWLVGVMLGYVLHCLRGKELRIPRFLVTISWLACLLVLASIIWGPYEAQQRTSQVSTLESALFEALSRVSWGLSVAWIVFACCHGYGGVINWFLSAPLWRPLSQLSYTIYVVHLIVQTTSIGIARTDISFSNYSAIRIFWGDFGIVLAVSVIMVLSFELPLATMEKYFLNDKPKVSCTVKQNAALAKSTALESVVSTTIND